MSPDENNSTDETEVLRADAVAPVDEPEQALLDPDSVDHDQEAPEVPSPYPDAQAPASPYPDQPSDTAAYPNDADGPYPDGGNQSPYPDGWGPGAPTDGYARAGMTGGGPALAQRSADPYPAAAVQYDPASEFEPPADLPPWYEDEYYDDRDWERLPRSTSTTFRVLVFVGVLAVALIATGTYVKGWIDDQLDPPGPEGAALIINIPQGASTNDIVRILDDEGVVANGTVFRYYLRTKDAGDWQAGEYSLNTNMAVWDVREILDEGPAPEPDTRQFVTVPEGLTTAEIEATLLAQVPTYDPIEMSDAVLAAAKPQLFEDEVLPNAEGYLFPETYDIDDTTNTDEQSFVNRMVSQFDVVAERVGLDAPDPALNVTPYQALIIASLIEEEAKADEDRAKIARVIYNRLDAGWLLGIDATVVYATGNREITLSDLESDSPYNTRKFVGLPPSPIASPGEQSIEAALNPADGDWMYYVLTEENGPGTHTFAVSEAEFEAAKAICIERDLGCG